MSLAKKTFWTDAALAGAVTGLMMVAFMYAQAFAGPGGLNRTLDILEVVAFVCLIFYFSRRRSMRYSIQQGFSYGQSVGFIIVTMIFVGFLYGIGYYFLLSSVDPAMVERAIHEAMTGNPFATPEAEALMRRWILSPVFWIFAMIIRMIVYGGILGLIISAFTRRNPDIFADEHPHDDNE